MYRSYIFTFRLVASSILLRSSIGLQDKVALRELTDNVGLIPIKLGQAKLIDYKYTLIHFYDLNPLISEINKLHLKASNITNILKVHGEYLADNAIYIQLLTITQNRVDDKIKEIIPHPNRMKRGLINMLGSVFKAISGNLDASDGERYDKIIREMQTNQKSLTESMSKQISISLEIVSKFNETINQVAKHEKVLESKIKQISWIVQKTTYTENSNYIRNSLIEIIELYTFVDSLLQDIENSITFCKLRTIHPSIIKTEDLFKELKALENRIGTDQMPLKPELYNINLFLNFIDIECFILNNRVTYLLHVPITLNEKFELFHLYSAPIFKESQFKAIIPRNRFLIKSKLHYTYRNKACHEITAQLYLCANKDLKEIHEESPCAVCLLSQIKESTACQPIDIQLNDPVINQLSNSDKWLLISPKKQLIKLQCPTQMETLNLIGTYIAEIPKGCQIMMNDRTIFNDQKAVNASIQPIFFPDNNELPSFIPSMEIDFKLDDIKLDGLQDLQGQIRSSKPAQIVPIDISKNPSIWTILMYVFAVAGIAYYGYKKFGQALCKKKQEIEVTLEHQPIQLPSMVQLNLRDGGVKSRGCTTSIDQDRC